MAALQSVEDFHQWLRTDDAPIIQHMRTSIEKQERTVDDVENVLIRNFAYDAAPVDGWKQYERAPIQFYELTFADKSFVSQFWHTERNEPLTYKQAREALDMKRLAYGDRRMLDEYVEDGHTRHRGEL